MQRSFIKVVATNSHGMGLITRQASATVLAAAITLCVQPAALAQPCPGFIFLTKVEYPTLNRPVDIEVADVDVDGLPDIITSHAGNNQNVNILYQLPRGASTSPVFGPPFTLMSSNGVDVNAVAVTQFDSTYNTWPDVLAVTARQGSNPYFPGELMVGLQFAQDMFWPPFTFDAPFFPGGAPDNLHDMVIADLDGDSIPDVATGADNGQGFDVAVFWGSSFGVPIAISAYEGAVFTTSIEAAHLNNDDFLDLIVSDRGPSPNNSVADDIVVLLNRGPGEPLETRFETVHLNLDVSGFREPSRVDADDVDADGDTDLIVSFESGNGAVSILVNESQNTQFVPSFSQGVPVATGVGGDWVEAGDLTDDEFPDLVVLDDILDRVIVFQGAGDGTFCELEIVADVEDPQRCRIVDLDEDGDDDIVIAAQDDTGGNPLDQVTVLLNGGDDDCNSNDIADQNEVFEDVTWINTDGGDWTTEDNWCPASDPADGELVDETIVFEEPESYPVLIDNGACTVADPDGLCFDRLVVKDGNPIIMADPAANPIIFIGDNGGQDGDITVGGDVSKGQDPLLEIAGGTLITGVRVGADNVHIATGRGTTGEIKVNGPDAVLESLRSEIVVGAFGEGTLTVENDGTVLGNELLLGGPIDTASSGTGTLTVRGANSKVDLDFTVELEQGTIELRDGGTLEASAIDIRDGVVRGDGTLEASVNNRGIIEPGSPIGTLEITSRYRQRDGQGDEVDTGRLVIDIGDPKAGEFDRLLIGNDSELAGALIVNADEDLRVLTPDSPALDFIQSTGPIDGQFDVALLPGISSDRYLSLAYNEGGNGVSLVVQPLGGDFGFNDGDLDEDLPRDGTPVAAALADLTSDGLLDVVIALPDFLNPTTATGFLVVFENAGDDNMDGVWDGFTNSVFYGVGIDPVSLVVGDIDGDGTTDVVVANRGDGSGNGSLTIARNENSIAGQLVIIQEPYDFSFSPEAIVIGEIDDIEINGENRLDVVVAGTRDPGDTPSRELAVGINLGNSTDWDGFAAPQTFSIGGGSTTFMDIGDLDNDTCLSDVLLGSPDSLGVLLVRNRGPDGIGGWNGYDVDNTTLIETGTDPFVGAIGDLNLDAKPDVVVADRDSGLLSVILYEGDDENVISYRPPADFSVGPSPRSLVLANLDRDTGVDTDLDLAVVTGTGEDREVRVFRNDIDANGQVQFVFSRTIQNEPLIVLAGEVDNDTGVDLVTLSGADLTEGDNNPRARIDTGQNTEPGPEPCNLADLDAPLGVLDLADVVAFVTAFGMNDLSVDFDNSGLLDLADITMFAGAFSSGCP